MSATPGAEGAAAGLLAEVTRQTAFALIRQGRSDEVLLLGGLRQDVDRLVDVPLMTEPPADGKTVDSLLLVPFRQIRERGFDCIDDAAPLSVIHTPIRAEVPIAELLAVLPDEPIGVTGEPGFETSDSEYSELVRRIIRDEIGAGQGANLVIARRFRATLADWGVTKALTVFRRLLEQERGAYWTFLVFTGDRYLIGASPERHIGVKGNRVRMNPISGTFRLEQDESTAARKARLLRFLRDEKEIFELFMVVDEELKTMCDVCDRGGQILGPYLKPMSHLIHTEYLLAGETRKDVRDVLRDSMFAATVTGSPVENACRLIRNYESEGRGYYAGVLALLGRDADGTATADAPIVLRTADVSPAGELTVTVGATLVRDSDPDSEAAETRAKAGGILTAFGLGPPAPVAGSETMELTQDEDVVIELARRNRRLSRFWLHDQSDSTPHPELAGRHAVVLDGEDGFVAMLRHLLRVLGMTSETIRYTDYRPNSFRGADLVVVGPGPGDPRDAGDPKIAAFRSAVDELLGTGQPFLAVCLGHQVLCGALDFQLVHKDIVFQGTQSEIDLLGRSERVGFYNTFVARRSRRRRDEAEVTADPSTGDVHLLSGSHFFGVQFHPESILTERGLEILRELVLRLLTTPTPPRPETESDTAAPSRTAIHRPPQSDTDAT